MGAQPYAGGITGTVTHGLAATLTAGQITAAQDTVSVWVVCADRWHPETVRRPCRRP